MARRQKNGTGSFRKRPDGTIEYRVTAGMGMDGKPIRPSFYGKTEADCLAQFKEWTMNNGKKPIEKVRTVGEWADTWLEVYKKDNISYGTYKNYSLYISKHVKPMIGHLKFSQVRPAHIAQLFASAKNHRGLPLSESARHDLYMVLKGTFETAIENRLCRESPVGKPKRVDLDKQISIKVFPLEQIDKLLTSDAEHAEYVKLLLYTGLRMGELLALKWSDIDLRQGIITVSKSIARAEGGGYIEKSTKSGKTRYVGITPSLAALLKSLPVSGFYVIANKDGTHVTPHQFEARYKKVLTTTGVDYLSPHKCRHTYATYLIKGGAELRAVQEILGHSKPEVTELYTHVDTEHIKNNVSKLGY